MKKQSIPLILLALTTAAATSCHSKQHSTHLDNKSTESVAELHKINDSVVVHTNLNIDTPQIEIEYLDPPRRRVTFVASKITTRSDAAASHSVKSDSTAETISNEISTSQSFSEPIANPPITILLILTCIAIIFPFIRFAIKNR